MMLTSLRQHGGARRPGHHPPRHLVPPRAAPRRASQAARRDQGGERRRPRPRPPALIIRGPLLEDIQAAIPVSISQVPIHPIITQPKHIPLRSGGRKGKLTDLTHKPKKTTNSNAVIHETLRIHPNTGTILERRAPPQGVVLDGFRIPGGTTVGVNAWVLHRDSEVYGPDAHVFRPERWLEEGTRSEEERLEMRRCLFSV